MERDDGRAVFGTERLGMEARTREVDRGQRRILRDRLGNEVAGIARAKTSGDARREHEREDGYLHAPTLGSASALVARAHKPGLCERPTWWARTSERAISGRW